MFSYNSDVFAGTNESMSLECEIYKITQSKFRFVERK